MSEEKSGFGTTLAVFGSALVALGIAWIIATNWHWMPSLLKILVLVVCTGAAFFAGIQFRVKDYPGIGGALIGLGALLYTLSIFLIAQIYSTSISLQGNCWLLLVSWLGIIAAAYAFRAAGTLVIGLVEFLIWIVLQFFALADRIDNISFGILALVLLFVGAIFYGLSKLDEEFANVYKMSTVLYLLIFGYILSFQSLIPHMWNSAGVSFEIVLFLIVLGVLAIGSAVFAFKNIKDNRELIGAGVVVAALLLMVFSSAMVTADAPGYCYKQQCYTLSAEECKQVDSCRTVGNSCAEFEVDGAGAGSCDTDSDYDSCVKSGCTWTPTYEGDCTFVKVVFGVSQWQRAQLDRCISSSFEGSSCDTLLRHCWDNDIDKETCISQVSSCSADGACTGNPRSVYNYFNCNNIYDAPTCDADSRCSYFDGGCHDSCRLNDDKKEACTSDLACEWRQKSAFSDGFPPLSVWFTWILINVLFILVILAFIGYGTMTKNSHIINLGIMFFALDIVTRYIGFIVDFWGYTSLSLLFIVGGLLLIFVGWRIEKWRRKLVDSTSGSQ